MKRIITTVALVVIASGVCLGQTREARVVGTIPGLPPSSMEIKPHENVTTAMPYRLPQLGDPLYDADREAEIKEHSHDTVRVYERGVFVGYSQITGVKRASENTAVPREGAFKVNPNLPADAVELPASAQPDPRKYYHTPPSTRPANVPSDCMLTRVFQGTNFIGWTYMSKKFVAQMHKPPSKAKRKHNSG